MGMGIAFTRYLSVVESGAFSNNSNKHCLFLKVDKMWCLDKIWSLYYGQKIKKVLMTGFAPFGELETNPSWEGVHSMDTKEIENKYNIILFKERIPVRYADVDLIVPQLLDSVRPDLTIHVGLSPEVSSFVLETQAKRDGYTMRDAAYSFPELTQNACHGPDSIITSLDVAAIRDDFNSYYSPGDELQAELSTDAGRYLCEYIYYTSLCRRQSPTLFVHVPLNKYTSEQLARGLEHILVLCLKQLAKVNDDK